MMRSRSNKAGQNVGRTDVERLLSEPAAGEHELAGLSSIVEAIGRVGENAPTEEEVRLFASEAAKQVPLGPDKSAARAVVGAGVFARQRARRRRLVIRLAGVGAALVVALAGFSGFAYAANGAVPGDTLYGADLALEKVGIGDGGLKERLTEASELVERGRFQEGLDLASDAVADSADGDEGLRAAAESLRVAAQSALQDRNMQTSEELGETAKQLREIASGDKTNQELGQAVEDLAGSLEPQGNGGTGGGAQDQGGSTDTTGSGSGSGPQATDPAGSDTGTGGQPAGPGGR